METDFELYYKTELAAIERAKSNKLFTHLLSPLEEAAVLNNYNPFFYKINEVELYISRYDCKSLLIKISAKVRLIDYIQSKQALLMEIPLESREAFEDPQIIMALNPRLRNRLASIECYDLQTIKSRGRRYFTEVLKFNKADMQTIDNLFKQYNCGELI
ncbi:MAG: hypothetical protein K0S33_3719 [Bacteroidetes bacterium]|jgi:uncharacterized protein YcgL (UPF0745 family)|nr:hypothetical protein [Bacteroidota bacterium]